MMRAEALRLRNIYAVEDAMGKVKKQPPDLTAGEFNRSE
jgi:hypothetical protein